MSISTGQSSANRYRELLSSESSPEFREEVQKQAEFLAFYSHLKVLGREQDTTPDLVRGNTQISIPAYFALGTQPINPVNEAALALLPRYSYSSGYGGTTDAQVNEAGLRESMLLPSNGLEAARRGYSAQFLVASTLGLLDPVAREAHEEVTNLSRIHWGNTQRHLHEVKDFITDVTRDLNETVVGEISEVAEMVQERGYIDFLDYLVDAKRVIAGRVGTIFSAEANTIPE